MSSSSSSSSVFPKKKINNAKVLPVKIEENTKPILGSERFDKLKGNIIIIGKKEQGKTTAICDIIDHTTDRRTGVFISSPTCFTDPVYKALHEKLIKKKYVTFFNTDTSKMEELIESVKAEDEKKELEKIKRAGKEELERPKEELSIFDLGIVDPKKDIKEFKSKYQKLDYFFVVDDSSLDSKSNFLEQLIKTSRHWQLKLVFSSQDGKDLKPAQLANTDYLILFPHVFDERLEHLHRVAALDIDIIDFKKIYKDATSEDHNFLYINTNKNKYRKNFDMEYQLPENPNPKSKSKSKNPKDPFSLRLNL